MAKALVGEVIDPASELRVRAIGPHFFTPDSGGACICGAGRAHRSHKARGLTVAEIVEYRRMALRDPLAGR